MRAAAAALSAAAGLLAGGASAPRPHDVSVAARTSARPRTERRVRARPVRDHHDTPLHRSRVRRRDSVLVRYNAILSRLSRMSGRKAVVDSAACRPSVYAAEHELSCVPPSGVAGRPSSLDIREPCLHRRLLPLSTPPPAARRCDRFPRALVGDCRRRWSADSLEAASCRLSRIPSSWRTTGCSRGSSSAERRSSAGWSAD